MAGIVRCVPSQALTISIAQSSPGRLVCGVLPMRKSLPPGSGITGLSSRVHSTKLCFARKLGSPRCFPKYEVTEFQYVGRPSIVFESWGTAMRTLPRNAGVAFASSAIAKSVANSKSWLPRPDCGSTWIVTVRNLALSAYHLAAYGLRGSQPQFFLQNFGVGAEASRLPVQNVGVRHCFGGTSSKLELKSGVVTRSSTQMYSMHFSSHMRMAAQWSHGRALSLSLRIMYCIPGAQA
mmetsp:Transcript_15842/g.37039  ORF Transcript_15842/g.37039 Transcript_15842/m.37039 type:complete len:236 (+) Transcript_15842:959-1666(+)